MRRWYSFLEIVQLPLVICFIGSSLIAFSGLFLNQSVSLFFSVNNAVIISIAEVCKYVGGVLITYFPILLLLSFLGKRENGTIYMFIGVPSYLAFNIMTMFFAKTSLPATAYSAVLGLSVNGSSYSALSPGTHMPLQTGLIGTVAIALVVRHCFNKSRSKTPYTLLFPYMDKNMWACFTSIIYSSIVGILFAFVWPYYITALSSIFKYIATDITNPMNIFIYGLLERLLVDTGLGNLIRNAFWYTELGGTWIQSFTGISVSGDVSIWLAQLNTTGNSLGPGRFITPYYVINLFAIPGMLIALGSMHSDPIEKRRIFRFIFIAIIVSLLGNALLPFEILLVIIAPLLFLFHLLYMAILFGIFQSAGIFAGYAYSGSLTYASPGNIFDLIYYLRTSISSSVLRSIILAGIISMIIYFVITRLYFQKAAVGVFDSSNLKHHTDLFISSVGGLDNIKSMNSSPTKLTVRIENKALLNYSAMQELRPTKIVETHAGLNYYIGGQSTMIKNEVLKRKKDSKRPD